MQAHAASNSNNRTHLRRHARLSFCGMVTLCRHFDEGFDAYGVLSLGVMVDRDRKMAGCFNIVGSRCTWPTRLCGRLLSFERESYQTAGDQRSISQAALVNNKKFVNLSNGPMTGMSHRVSEVRASEQW